MSLTAWPNQETCTSNAQGRLTDEQQYAIGKPLPFQGFLGMILILLLIPGFIIAANGVVFLPVLIPELAIKGAINLQFMLALLLMLLLLVILSVVTTKEFTLFNMLLFTCWLIAAVIITMVLGWFARGFLFSYCIFMLAIVLLIALSQLRVIYRADIIGKSSIISAEGSVHWQENGYVGAVQGKQLLPLLSVPHLSPGRYRLYFYRKLPLLLSAEPLLSSLPDTSDAQRDLQEALFMALCFTPSDLLLHQRGSMAPSQLLRWHQRIRKRTSHTFFSVFGITFSFFWWIGVLALILTLDSRIPFLQIVTFIIVIGIFVAVAASFARKTSLRERKAAEAEHILTWSGQITTIKPTSAPTLPANELYYDLRQRLLECRSGDQLIGYLPERLEELFLPGNSYRIYTLASTSEIVSAEIIAETSDPSLS